MNKSILLGVVTAMFLSSSVYAEESKGEKGFKEKPGQEKMSFEDRKANMTKHISEMKEGLVKFETCVNNAKEKEDLKACHKMMKKQKEKKGCDKE